MVDARKENEVSILKLSKQLHTFKNLSGSPRGTNKYQSIRSNSMYNMHKQSAQKKNIAKK